MLRISSALHGNFRCSTLDLAQVVGRKLDAAAATFSSSRRSLVVPGIGTLLMQSVFRSAARRRSAGGAEWCALAAPVTEKRIGRNR
jgi:hypothetical protein